MAGFFKKHFGKKEKKLSPEIRDIIDNLKLLAAAETNISVFYKLCAEASASESDLWTAMSEAEVGHARNLRKMSALIAEAPDLYTPGYSFNPTSIRLFSLHVETLVGEMKAGKIPLEKLFPIALDIENSAVELNVVKIVDTTNEEYNELARQIDSESEGHRAAVSEKSKG
jgi:hypothetical protein